MESCPICCGSIYLGMRNVSTVGERDLCTMPATVDVVTRKGSKREQAVQELESEMAQVQAENFEEYKL